jgi:DNA-binding Xre family transcriptional regulator
MSKAPKTKYRIKQIISEYPASRQSAIRKEICKRLEIDPPQLSVWENITEDEKTEIKLSYMQKLAHVLMCTIEDLMPTVNV